MGCSLPSWTTCSAHQKQADFPPTECPFPCKLQMYPCLFSSQIDKIYLNNVPGVGLIQKLFQDCDFIGSGPLLLCYSIFPTAILKAEILDGFPALYTVFLQPIIVGLV